MYRKITDVWPDLIVQGEYIQDSIAEAAAQVPAGLADRDADAQGSNVQQVGLSEE